MSRNGDLVHRWGGEDRTFRFAWSEFEKLQEACDCGPFQVLAHLSAGLPRIEHILETIRWGLVGGGMSVPDAGRLVDLYVKERPLAENLLTAQLVLGAGIHGSKDEPPKKSKAGRAKRARSQTGN